MNIFRNIICMLIFVSGFAFFSERASAQDTLTATHFTTPETYTPGSDMIVTCQIKYTGTLTALGMSVNLPRDWAFVSVQGDDIPNTSVLDTGDIDFFWPEIPIAPVDFSYTVHIPQATTEPYQKEISANVLYRRPEIATELPAQVLPDPLLFQTEGANLKGDISGDHLLNLSDAILSLKASAGADISGVRADYVSSGVDANGNSKVGIEEVIYILKRIAGLS
jgi:hypothetical protein